MEDERSREPEKGELPEGWTETTLGAVCAHPQYGWTTSAKHAATGLRLLRTTDISGGNVNWSTVPFCDKRPPDPGKYLLGHGDILVSRAGSVGISHLVRECPAAVFASYLIRLRALPPIPPTFLRLFLMSPRYWAAISDGAAGIAVQNINATKLQELVLPLPPIAEQKRIVAKVEELLARVSAARDRLATVPAILKRFRQSVLAAACSGRLTEDLRDGAGTDQWEAVALEDLTELVTSGSRGWARYYADKGAVFVRAQNLSTDRLDLSEVAHVRVPAATEGKRTRVSSQDILITITGANVTKTALVTKEIGEAYVNQHVALMRLKDKTLAPYLWVWLVSPDHGRSQLLDAAYGAGKPGLNLTQIRSVEVHLPPLPEQREIVRRTDHLFTLADTIEKHIAMGTARAEKLMQAILAKAFRGELVSTEAQLARQEGREYEPASVLLESGRIANRGSSGRNLGNKTEAG